MTTITIAPKYTKFTMRQNRVNGNYMIWAKNPETGAAWCNVGLYSIRTLEEAEEILSDLKKEEVA
jgi:hypothetical protein